MRHGGRAAYSPVAKLWHWLTVALIVAQVTLGWTMPDARRGVSPATLNDIHMTIGLTLLLVVVLRFAWRLAEGTPPFEPMPAWQALAAHSLHLFLYAVIVLFVLTGWANATMHGWPIHFFFVLPLPAFPAWPAIRAFAHVHNWLVWVLIAAVTLHVAAALWHQFVSRDRTLVRMLPVSLGGTASEA